MKYVGERQILYNITYIWNLKNKTNANSKTETDRDTENKLVVTSEEKEGEGQYRNRGKMVIMTSYEIMYVKLENFKTQYSLRIFQ